MTMKLFLTGLLMVLGMSVQAKDYQYQTVDADQTKTRIYTLDNGLKVYLSVNKEKPRIQTYIAVRTGSKNDPAETTGLAHYLEHLMFNFLYIGPHPSASTLAGIGINQRTVAKIAIIFQLQWQMNQKNGIY